MKKSVLIKLVKEQLAKKKVVKEQEGLSSLAQAIADAIEFGTPPFEFGKAVAEVLYDEFANEANKSEVAKSFLEGFNSVKPGESQNEVQVTIPKKEPKVYSKQGVIDYLETLDPEFVVFFPRMFDATGTFSSHESQVTTAGKVVAALKNPNTQDGQFEEWHKGKDFTKFALVQSEDDQKKMEKLVRGEGPGAGSLD